MARRHVVPLDLPIQVEAMTDLPPGAVLLVVRDEDPRQTRIYVMSNGHLALLGAASDHDLHRDHRGILHLTVPVDVAELRRRHPELWGEQ